MNNESEIQTTTITIGKRKTITLAAYLLWKMSKKEV